MSMPPPIPNRVPDDPCAPCEATLFSGRDEDDWFLLEWWGPEGGWAVYNAPREPLYDGSDEEMPF
ncbi:MAG TPA: hypothetical protein VI589_06925 [Vicinamibacteria bacterium]